MSTGNHLLRLIRTQHEVQDRDRILHMAHDQLKVLSERIKDAPVAKYTGWFALFAIDNKAPGGVRFLKMFNPDECEEGEEPEWAFCLPMPEPESMREFEGW